MNLHNTPFYHPDDVIAIRSLQMAMADKSLQLSFFPEDFEMINLGSFDDSTGKFNQLDKPRLVITGLTCQAMLMKRQQDIIKRQSSLNEQTQKQVDPKTVAFRPKSELQDK